jgi:hypothetical protein
MCSDYITYTLVVIPLIFLTSLPGLQLRGGLRNIEDWSSPVFPLADSPWKARPRGWMDAVHCFIVTLDLFGRLAVRLI